MVGHIRAFHHSDAPLLVELIKRGMPADPVSADWFAEYVLLDRCFDPRGLLVATGGPDDVPLGFVYAVRGHGDAGPDDGWITIGVVDPAIRRRGIGSALISQALSYLRAAGARWVEFSGYPPAYFLPGLDVETYPDGHRLLERAGFHVVSRPVAMGTGLATHRTPDAVLALRESRVKEGYEVRTAGYGDLPEVVSFAASEFAPDWGEAVRAAVVRTGRPDRVVVVRDPSGVVVGFAAYGAYRGLIERFGPFGIAATERGRGLGAVVLHATLTRMRAEGAHSAWFLWTGRDTPAGRLYASAGFSVTRTFQVMRADLR